MAQPNMTRTVGLALEGGGYRGMYTAGVLDVWMEHGFDLRPYGGCLGGRGVWLQL